MSSVNKVIILGNLGKDPEMHYLTNGDAVVTFSVATSRKWKNKDSGEKVEETEWHRMVAFSRLAEVIGEWLKKGSQCYFEGRLKTRKWEKDGVTHYSTEVIVESMQMLGEKRDKSGDDEGRAAPNRSASAPPPSKPAADTNGWPDDDIPF
jgi:single-strand DNA-binding protein